MVIYHVRNSNSLHKVPNGQAKTEPDHLVQSTVKSSPMVEIGPTRES